MENVEDFIEHRTSFSTIYASAYIASVRDYFFNNDIQITNDKIFKIMSEIDPYKTKEIVIDKKFEFSILTLQRSHIICVLLFCIVKILFQEVHAKNLYYHSL